jgi:CheY-like chemotaxis protein
MSENLKSVLLIETNLTLRELNELILAEAGYDVALVPLDTDPQAFAARVQPNAIVISIGPTELQRWDLVDRLRADPRTNGIPLVVISSTEHSAVEAQASPNVRETVVMPYDIDALREAVGKAIGNPPPAAALPDAQEPVQPAFRHAAEVLNRHSRGIVLRAIERLRRDEPYRSHFAELSRGLLDDLPSIVGAITGGLLRGLPPHEVADVSEVHLAICQHVHLRRGQGLPTVLVGREYVTLVGEMLRVLEDEAAGSNFSPADAFAVARRINALLRAVMTVAMNECDAIGVPV